VTASSEAAAGNTAGAIAIIASLEADPAFSSAVVNKYGLELGF